MLCHRSELLYFRQQTLMQLPACLATMCTGMMGMMSRLYCNFSIIQQQTRSDLDILGLCKPVSEKVVIVPS